MALVHFDGFEDYSTDTPASLRYGGQASTSNWNVTVTYQADGRFSDSKSLQLSASAQVYFDYFMPTGVSGAAAGISMKLSSLSTPTSGTAHNGISFYNLARSDQVNVTVQANGAIVVWRASTVGSNTIATSSAGLVVPDAWFHLAAEITRSATTGTVNVYVDGVQVISATGANTYASDIAIVGVHKQGVIANFDDFYVCDSAAWLGEARSTPLVVTGDTAQIDFTPSTGVDNYACVDELPPNMSDYVTSDSPGDKDRYTVSDLSFAPVAILGVKVTALASKDDITTRTMRANLKSGSTTANGTTKALSSSYKFLEDIFPTDPDTSAAWIKSGVDAIEVGIEVVA